jgi:hypothetical protein
MLHNYNVFSQPILAFFSLLEERAASMLTCKRLMRPISARYPTGLSLRVSARILLSRLAS